MRVLICAMARRWRRRYIGFSRCVRILTIGLSTLCLFHIYMGYTESQRKLSAIKLKQQSLFLWKEKQQMQQKADGEEIASIQGELKAAAESDKCVARKGLVFVKTHKTASTTVNNILLRHAEKRQLIVGLPPERRWELGGYPAPFDPAIIDPQLRKYDVLCHHIRFNRNKVRRVVPDNSLYITILREPSDCFESGFSFFRDWPYTDWLEDAPSYQALEEFLDRPHVYYNTSTPWYFRAKNYQAFDLGFDNDRSDAYYTKNAIQKVEEWFDLVMITEKLDESLILLKDKLCMDSFDDIVYIRLKVRQQAVKQTLTKRMREQIRSWNSLDTHLYSYFAKRLEEQIDEYGRSRMYNELFKFRALVEATNQKCVDEYNMDDMRPWVSRIRLRENSGDVCDKLSWGEVKFGDYIRQLQKSYSDAANRKQLSHSALTQLLKEAQLKVIGEEGVRKSA